MLDCEVFSDILLEDVVVLLAVEEVVLLAEDAVLLLVELVDEVALLVVLDCVVLLVAMRVGDDCEVVLEDRLVLLEVL